MTNESTFDFLKEDGQFSFIYKKCIEMEKIIKIKVYDSAIWESRKISEYLLYIIIKNQSPSFFEQLRIEKLNNGPYTSFCKLINSVYNERLISLEIRNKYHKIRIMGNEAIYSNHHFTLEDSKVVHEILFQLALDCFKRFNSDKISGIKYTSILMSDVE